MILMYDITSAKSFNDTKIWKREIDNNAPEDVIICVVGNKCDLENQRQVSMRKGKAYAKEIGALFAETSAKENIGINELFHLIGEQIVERNADKIKESDPDSDDDMYVDTSSLLVVDQSGVVQNARNSQREPTWRERCCRGQ